MKIDLQKLVESIAPPVIAIFLWAILIVVVLLATASAGSRALEVLIAGVGALGQVFFAWMVWRLGREQFQYTKSMADKAERLTLHDRRIRFITDYVAWSESNLAAQSGELDKQALPALRIRSKAIFEPGVVAIIDKLIELFVSRLQADAIVQIATERNEPDEVLSATIERDSIQKRLETLNEVLQTIMTLSIDGPFGHWDDARIEKVLAKT